MAKRRDALAGAAVDEIVAGTAGGTLPVAAGILVGSVVLVAGAGVDITDLEGVEIEIS